MSTERLRRGHEVIFEWSNDDQASPYLSTVFERERYSLPVVDALIDTGADVSLLPRAMISLLGLRESDLRRTAMSGVGGGVTTLTVERAGIVAVFGIWRIELPRVDFIAGVPAILGRDAFFGPMELRMNRYEIGLRTIERIDAP